jgi:hypothetical protein
VLDVETNSINGGSFAVTACKASSRMRSNDNTIDEFRRNESAGRFDSAATYSAFKARVTRHRSQLVDLIGNIVHDGRTVFGYGASTKGNVILQYCQFTTRELPCIAEVNTDKFGCFTPGTLIPIVSEPEAHEMNPDYLLVMPWHFRTNLIARESDFLSRGGGMIFPLPDLDIVQGPIH